MVAKECLRIEKGKRPGKMFCRVFVEVLAFWYLAPLFGGTARFAFMSVHFKMQEVVKHVPMTFGVCCYGFALFVSKDVRFDGGGMCHTTPLPWSN